MRVVVEVFDEAVQKLMVVDGLSFFVLKGVFPLLIPLLEKVVD